MKQIIAMAFVLCIAATASAQSSTGSSANGTSNSTTTKSKKGTTAAKDNRKMYPAKNGQSATVTGHEATGVNGGYSSIKKEAPKPKPKPTPKRKNKEE